MEKGKNKSVIQIIIFAVTFVIAFFGTKYVMSGFSSKNVQLEKMAAEMNKDCPKQMDAETRLDSANVFDNTFQYNFSLVNFSKEDPSVDIESVKNFVETNAQHNLDSNTQMKYFREKDVTVKYNYKDKKGEHVFDFSIKSKK